MRALLSGGPLPSLQIHEWAIEHRIPRMLLFQAKTYAGIQARRDGRAQRWCWELLPAEPAAPIDGVPVRRLHDGGGDDEPQAA